MSVNWLLEVVISTCSLRKLFEAVVLWIVTATYKLEFGFSVIYSGNPRNSCQRKVNVIRRRARSNGQFSIRRCYTSGKGSTQTTMHYG